METQGLQSLNYHAHCVNAHDTAVGNAWSAAAKAHSRLKRHEWVRWANKEHGLLLYQYKKQAEQWLREAEVRLARRMPQASKPLRITPRKAPAKKLKPVHSRPQEIPQCNAVAMPITGRPRWVPPVEDDSDYEVPYIDHAV